MVSGHATCRRYTPCEIHHLHLLQQGRFAVQLDSGEVQEFEPNDVMDIPQAMTPGSLARNFFALIGAASVASFATFLLAGSLLSLQVAFGVLTAPWGARAHTLPALEGVIARLAALVGATGALVVGALLLLAPAQLGPLLLLTVGILTV